MIKYPGIVLLFCKACRNGIRYAPQACGKQIRMFLFLPHQTATGNGNTYRRTGNHFFDSVRRTAQNGQIRKPYRKRNYIATWNHDPERVSIPADLFIFLSLEENSGSDRNRGRMQKRTMKKYLPKLFPNRYILPVFRYELRSRKKKNRITTRFFNRER